MKKSQFIDSVFGPLRVTGKNLLSFPDIRNYVRNCILNSKEKTLPRNTILYSSENIQMSMPTTLSLFSSCHNCSQQYFLEKSLNCILLDDQQIVNDLKPLFQNHGLNTTTITDVQFLFHNMGINGYITKNGKVVIMEAWEYFKTKYCGCDERSEYKTKYCGCDEK